MMPHWVPIKRKPATMHFAETCSIYHCAALFNMKDRIGVVAHGIYVDLLAIEGDPLEYSELFLEQGAL